jgi:hypothetical protein
MIRLHARRRVERCFARDVVVAGSSSVTEAVLPAGCTTQTRFSLSEEVETRAA